ncbi:hypothetical protein [Asticcacaulis excentricus]|nr:hypothetical protein [Asticcacaulis excentricus]
MTILSGSFFKSISTSARKACLEALFFWLLMLSSPVIETPDAELD